VPLDSAETLVDRAVAETGLGDFGDGAWRDGLDALLGALADAHLNDMGEATFTFTIANALRQRLGVVDWLRREPEIGLQPIESPVIVVGLPRTGTTALAHLLAADRDTRSLRTWEASTPVPPPERATEGTDPRIAATQAGIDIAHQLMPGLPRLYFATAASPSEALDLMAMSFRSWQATGPADVPAYEDWLLRCDMHDAYAFEAEVLRLLQWRCPPTRWAWKNPPDVAFLDAVRATYPDARFVWTHRDPTAALTSVCSLLAVVASPGSDHFEPGALGPRQTELWGRAIDRGLATRAAMGEDAFVDVFMPDLVRDPITTVATLYAALGWAFTEHAEAAMRAWLAGNPQHGRGEHRPDPAPYGLDARAVAERFSAYTDRFGAQGGWT
jgi:Sulfotransferase family